MAARAYWVTGPGMGTIRPVEPQPRPEGWVRVVTLFSGISRGTEALVFRGAVPPSQFEAMRAPFQEGAFPHPVKYGYAAVGRVVEGPPDLAGAAVFCLHPHQTEFTVPAEAVLPLPPDLPPARAVLAANMETAVNIVWDLVPGPGDRVGVIGAGVVGCLAAWLVARIPGCEVTLIDVDPRRAEIAAVLGVGFARPEAAAGDLDRIVHASGDPGGLVTALALAGAEAAIVEASWYGDREVALPLGEAFHSRRLRIVASQVGSVAARQRARWTHRRRLGLALRLLRAPVLDGLITGEDWFDDLPGVMARLAARPDGALCHRIRYASGAAEPSGASGVGRTARG